MIRQGDVYWLRFDGLGSEPAGRRPAVVVQQDVFNASTIRTVVVAAVTSNLRLALMPGNVRLPKGAGGLGRASVVNVTQLLTVDRGRLVERIGSLDRRRRDAVMQGVALVLGVELAEPYENSDRQGSAR